MNRRSFFAALAVAPLVPLETTQRVVVASRIYVDARGSEEANPQLLRAIHYGDFRLEDGTLVKGPTVYDPREEPQS